MHAENKTLCKENGLSWAGLATSPHCPTRAFLLTQEAGNDILVDFPSHEHMLRECLCHSYHRWCNKLSIPPLPVHLMDVSWMLVGKECFSLLFLFVCFLSMQLAQSQFPDEALAPAVEAWSLNHWTSREFCLSLTSMFPKPNVTCAIITVITIIIICDWVSSMCQAVYWFIHRNDPYSITTALCCRYHNYLI